MRTFPGCVMLLTAGLLAAALLALPGCEPEVPGVIDGSCSADRRDTVVSDEYFASTMEPFFHTYCSLCHYEDRGDDRHGAPETVNYDTKEAASALIASTWFRVSTYDMPPVGRVPNLEEMATLNEWLNCMLAEQDTGDDDDSAGDDDDSAR